MKNSAKTTGNGNNVFQDISSSEINIHTNKEKKAQRRTYKRIGIIIAILTLLVSIILGWDSIVQFFR